MANPNIKPAIEIGSLAGQLTPMNQAFVLTTINAFLYSQKLDATESEEAKKPQKAASEQSTETFTDFESLTSP